MWHDTRPSHAGFGRRWAVARAPAAGQRRPEPAVRPLTCLSITLTAPVGPADPAGAVTCLPITLTAPLDRPIRPGGLSPAFRPRSPRRWTGRSGRVGCHLPSDHAHR